jgi:hypothetical protein
MAFSVMIRLTGSLIAEKVLRRNATMKGCTCLLSTGVSLL